MLAPWVPAGSVGSAGRARGHYGPHPRRWGKDLGRDPPYKSLSDGRGLPHTRMIRALLPFIAAAIVAVLVLTAALATISTLFG
jgi:hypothetical protein